MIQCMYSLLIVLGLLMMSVSLVVFVGDDYVNGGVMLVFLQLNCIGIGVLLVNMGLVIVSGLVVGVGVVVLMVVVFGMYGGVF